MRSCITNFIHSGRTWGWLCLAVALGIAGAGLAIFQAKLLSGAIASVFLEGAGLAQVSGGLRLLLLIFTLRAGLALSAEVCANRAALQVKTALRNHFVAHLFELGPAYTRGERSGELVTTAVEGIEALDAYYSQYLPQLALAAFIPLVILLVVFPLDLLTAILLLATAPLIPVFMVLIGKMAETATRRHWSALTRLGAHFLDTLQGLTALKLLNQSRARASSIAQASERYRQATMGILRITFLSALVLELVATISTALVAVEVGLRLLNGQLDYPKALFILVLVPDFYLPLRTLGMRFHAGMAGVTAGKRIAAVMAEPALPPYAPFRTASDPQLRLHPYGCPEAVPITEMGLHQMDRGEMRIGFENGSYAYPEGKGDDRWALRNVSLEINAGEHTVLVGPSGAGKSTILQLLLRFMEPTQGRIVVGGELMSAIRPEVWRSLIAWVPQIPYLFNDTLLANLRLGKPESSREEVEAALRLAHLDDFVRSLPQGLETVCGENGARLSGGQAQRLALARAFLRDAPLLLLDEPGANLDAQQEAWLQDSLARLSQGHTVLTIAHRLGTIRRAERVILLERGQVIGCGSHQELAASSSAYAALWQKHA